MPCSACFAKKGISFLNDASHSGTESQAPVALLVLFSLSTLSSCPAFNSNGNSLVKLEIKRDLSFSRRFSLS